MALLALVLLLDPLNAPARPQLPAVAPFAKVRELRQIDYGLVPEFRSRFFDPSTLKVRELLAPDFTRD